MGYKLKPNKAVAKRFKLTASGKAKHRKAFRGHKLSHKNAKRKRQLRQDNVVDGVRAEIQRPYQLVGRRLTRDPAGTQAAAGTQARSLLSGQAQLAPVS